MDKFGLSCAPMEEAYNGEGVYARLRDGEGVALEPIIPPSVSSCFQAIEIVR